MAKLNFLLIKFIIAIEDICCSNGSHRLYETESPHSMGYWLAL